MKFLILGLVALATLASVQSFDLTQWNPVPVDDLVVEEAIKDKKAQIILDVIQSYPNITHDPIFTVNYAEKKISGVKIAPPVVLYRLNLTLTAFVTDPSNSKFRGFPTPIVTFNVTISSRDHDGHVDFYELKYAGIDLPHLPKPVPEEDEDTKPDPFKWNPVPTDDSVVNEAIKDKKAQIILDVIQAYPNITHDPIFIVNYAEKKFGPEKISPPFVLYRLNLTLSAYVPLPFNSKFRGTLKSIVNFNVTISSREIGGHVDFYELHYEGIELPHLPKPVPEDLKSTVEENKVHMEDIAANDTGLWIAITALQDDIWKNLKENKIPRPNATSAPKDDFGVYDSHRFYSFIRNKTTGNLQSDYNVVLTLKKPSLGPRFSLLPLLFPKKPVEIWVQLSVEHKDQSESFFLSGFKFVANPADDKDNLIGGSLDLISPGPTKDDGHKCDHYLGDPQPIDKNSKHFWTVFNALKSDVLKLLRVVKFLNIIPDDSFFIFKDGLVKYKDNHGDLDKPIIREIEANFTVAEHAISSVDLLPPKTIIESTKVILQESINPVNAQTSFKLLQIDHCKVDGACP